MTAANRFFFRRRPALWLVALAVSLVHLVAFLAADRLHFGWVPSSIDPSPPIRVEMLSIAPPPPPPSAPPPRRPQPPALIPELPRASPAPTEQAAEASAAPAPQADPAPAPGIETMTPTAEDLPRQGAIAIEAFWGNYTEGSKIADGFIELNFEGDDRYSIRLVTKATGWASLFVREPLQAETWGSMGPGGLKPDGYSHASPRDRNEVIRFDYDEEKIFYSTLKEPLNLLNGTQDRLSFMIQLAWMLKMAPERFSLGEEIRLPMATRRRVEEVGFFVRSDEDIVLPGGILVPALQLSTHRSQDRFSGRIDVWLDRADRLLPVRIRFEENRGQIVDLLAIRRP